MPGRQPESTEDTFISQCESYLSSRWTALLDQIQQSNLPQITIEESLKDKIVKVLNSTTKSYHYVLPTQLLAKIVDSTLDCRSLQKSFDSPGAFDARSVAHKVIVPFDAQNHNVLGGSPEPYVNNPLRFDAIVPRHREQQRNRPDWDLMVEILSTVEDFDRDTLINAYDFILLKIHDLLANVVVTYPVPSRVSFDRTISLIQTFIAVPSGGERNEAVATALFQNIKDLFHIFDNVKREKVNAADSASGMAADIECYLNDEIILLVEVKDRDLTLTQLNSKLDTARSKRIKEILFLAQERVIPTDTQVVRERVINEFSSGQNIYITTILEFMKSPVMLFGETGRVAFLRKIGTELDRVNSPILHKRAWADLLRSA